MSPALLNQFDFTSAFSRCDHRRLLATLSRLLAELNRSVHDAPKCVLQAAAKAEGWYARISRKPQLPCCCR